MYHNRVFYCPHCFANGRPKISEFYISVNQKSEYFVHEVEKIDYGNRGFTPHIVSMTESKEGNVYFSYVCAMANCGFTLQHKGEGRFKIFRIDHKVQSGVIPIKDWNALIKFTDKDYSLC